MKLYIKTSIFTSILIFFTACDPSEYKSQGDGKNITGIVVDGYIKNSDICLDKNKNGSCDTDEPSTTSNEDGYFEFENLQLEDSGFFPIISHGGIDNSTQKEFIGELKHLVDLSSLSTYNNLILSPLTDLVATSFLSSDANSTLELNNIKTLVSQVLGVSKTDLNKDPMKDIDVFAKSQELQHTKHLIETSALKTYTTTPDEEKVRYISEKIKEELINQNFDLQRVLIAMNDVHLENNIPENEKVFIPLQVNELTSTLDALSHDTSLSIDNLNRIQKSIDIKQTLAIDNLKEADSNSTIVVVDVDTTTESVTQSPFDITNAVFDQYACKEDNSYNSLSNSGFFNMEKSSDQSNGIAIKSNFSGDSQSVEDRSKATIFYPILEVIKANDEIVVFQDGYYFAFDKAWKNNTNKTIYVMTPKTDTQESSCYRYVLNFSVANNIKGTKVYRYTDI
jgi:hypothetical protein